MKKGVRFIAVMLVAAVVVCAFAGCVSLDKTIVGKWENSGSSTSIEFKDDGSVTFDFGSITIMGVPVSGAIDGTYTVNTEKEPAEITIVPDLPFVNINLIFTAVYEEDVLTLNNSDWNLNYTLTKVEE